MAQAPFRGLTYLDLDAANAITKVNSAFNNLVRGISGFILISIAGTGTYTLTDTNDDDEAKHGLIIFTGVLTGNRAIVFPTLGRTYLLVNATTGAFTVTCRTSGGTGVAISQGTAVWTYFDDQDDDIHAATGIGETNTVSNIGTGGIGIYKQKTGVNFELRTINAASSKITVALDGANNEVDVDADPTAIAAGIDLGDLATRDFADLENVPDAEADGATKGIAAFDASDFDDDGSGIIAIDYTNAQKATGAQPGFLTAADWNTFNNKLGGYRTTLLSDIQTNVFEIELTANTSMSGWLTAVIIARDASNDMQHLMQEVFFNAINKGGVYTLDVMVRPDEWLSVTAGTLTATWALTSGASKAIMSVTPAGSLTETTYELRYTLINFSTQHISYF